MLAPVTVFYAVALVVMKLFLVARVIVLRRRYRVGLGDGGHRDLEAAIRAHANFIEHMPLMLVLMFIGEMNGVDYSAINTVGLLFVVSRGLHAIGMAKGQGRAHVARFLGVVGTWLALLGICGLLIHNIGQIRYY